MASNLALKFEYYYDSLAMWWSRYAHCCSRSSSLGRIRSATSIATVTLLCLIDPAKLVEKQQRNILHMLAIGMIFEAGHCLLCSGIVESMSGWFIRLDGFGTCWPVTKVLRRCQRNQQRLGSYSRIKIGPVDEGCICIIHGTFLTDMTME